MYRNTRFGQIMEGLPRSRFEKIVREENADKYCKGFRRWDQMTAMIFNQLSGANSLRELEAGFNSQSHYHYHLGTHSIKRSTLADANNKRSSDIFARVCTELIQYAHGSIKRELKALVYLLDSSPIFLSGPGFDEWAKPHRTKITQGLKLHLMLEQQARLPVYAMISPANDSDILHGRKIDIEPGATYVFDKGYYDYNWWKRINDQGAHFVARLKKNAAVAATEQHAINKDSQKNILEDTTIRFTRKVVGTKSLPNPYLNTPARRVTVNRPDKDTPMVLITNDFTRSAEEIAALYKKRWDIELFFKWIKQNLKIKRFLGRSENAVRTQIYIALITYVLLYLYRKSNKINDVFSLCLSTLKTGLFQRPETEYQIALRRRREREEWFRLQGALPL
ncbi:IS4 family transposase [Thiomicrospira sp.]|uniref:IS4 family transposase n=1 Tax=Thiomicrospira sp. TaxID=935 RepID=UPI002F93337A